MHNKETILYGCKIGQPDYMEEILFKQRGYVNQNEVMEHAKKWAKENNYDRLRFHVVDLSEKPDFTKTLN